MVEIMPTDYDSWKTAGPGEWVSQDPMFVQCLAEDDDEAAIWDEAFQNAQVVYPSHSEEDWYFEANSAVFDSRPVVPRRISPLQTPRMYWGIR